LRKAIELSICAKINRQKAIVIRYYNQTDKNEGIKRKYRLFKRELGKGCISNEL